MRKYFIQNLHMYSRDYTSPEAHQGVFLRGWDFKNIIKQPILK